MDTVAKRAAGETLSVRDEQRLRNHQLRMMRRAWLNDIIVSPREPLFPNNNLHEFGSKPQILFRRAIMIWQSIGAKLLVPSNRNWHYQPIVLNELCYGNPWKVPQLWAYRWVWRIIGMSTLVMIPAMVAFGIVQEEMVMRRYPTVMNALPNFGTLPVTSAARIKVFPGDDTFTTRLRNVEWGHDTLMGQERTPRLKPDAKTYPLGTRMSWVTWQPILPEDNFLETPDYGNGPGGVGHMSETYRLVHMTKARGLYSKDHPDEPNIPFTSSITKNVMRPLYSIPAPINDPSDPANQID